MLPRLPFVFRSSNGDHLSLSLEVGSDGDQDRDLLCRTNCNRKTDCSTHLRLIVGSDREAQPFPIPTRNQRCLNDRQENDARPRMRR